MGAVIDFSSINKTVFASRDYKVKSLELAERYVNRSLASRKRELLEEFNSHAVTQEIEAGADGANISGTLGGYGNLFSFIVFTAGDRPTQKLRSLLESIQYQEPKYVDGKWIFVIPIPSRKAIISATPFEWQKGAGWAIEVEKGISGFGHFLASERKGRSGGGIEVEKAIRRISESSRMPYLTPMLERFRVNFERIRE